MRKILIMLSLTSILGGCSGSGLLASCPVRWLPPAQFDGDPNPYPVIWEYDQWDVDGHCRAATDINRGEVNYDGRRYACEYELTLGGDRVPMVVVSKVGPGINDQCHTLELEHEFGHANRWASNHPDARSAQ